ncbi:MAG: thioredoxin [Lachnospiraceae bacterium]|nr:thioredoxin [Lachnospiraceae bacterium]MCI9333874.1 thioredoxin [Lachnospiraceae bacterium]
MLTGLVLLGIGALEGQFSVIYKKAVMICLECIGIG